MADRIGFFLQAHSDRARFFVIPSRSASAPRKALSLQHLLRRGNSTENAGTLAANRAWSCHNVWATQRKNETKLDEAYRSGDPIILLFSVQRSDAFQGYAQMRSSVGRSKLRGLDPFNGFGRLFDVEWLRLHDLPFREVQHLRTGDVNVTMARDGQEIENNIGRRPGRPLLKQPPNICYVLVAGSRTVSFSVACKQRL
eukprot:Skav230615  [mRNA]  locus=scaffold3185:66492:71078:- [translate_table: standard]